MLINQAPYDAFKSLKGSVFHNLGQFFNRKLKWHKSKYKKKRILNLKILRDSAEHGLKNFLQ